MKRHFLLSLVFTALLVLFTQAAYAEVFSMGPLSYDLPKHYNIMLRDDNGLFATNLSKRNGLLMLCVSIDDELDACTTLNVTLNWVKQQLSTKGEFVVSMFDGLDTVRVVKERISETNTLLACYIQGVLVVGYEKWNNGDLEPGMKLQGFFEQLARSAEAEETATPTP